VNEPKPRGKNPWEGLTEKEKKRRVRKMQATRMKTKALQIHRPPASEIETIEVPVGGERVTGVSRLDRLAALIVAVEKLL